MRRKPRARVAMGGLRGACAQHAAARKKGDAVQSVADGRYGQPGNQCRRQSDGQAAGVKAPSQQHDERRAKDDSQRSAPNVTASDLSLSPCASAGATDRCLVGRPGPSLSLPSAVNLNGLAALDESAFTPNRQRIRKRRAHVRAVRFKPAKTQRTPPAPRPAAPNRSAACECVRTARRDSDAPADCHA
ncbi:hypothetical protein bAD24_I04280 [Burkholderia sp. AD24]|nr:hypothetical protein bAD24_I04280 [Burkholderia sp. AD24]